MNRPKFLRLLTTFASTALFFASSCAPQAAPAGAPVPAGIDHAKWDSLLKKHVDPKGLVNYKAWKNSPEDLKTLDTYLAQFGQSAAQRASGDELGSSAVNAYNAFAIRTILENYPVKSIEDIDKAFKQKTHDIAGQIVSLDDIEKGIAIPQLGARAHAVVVCCAKSCPPLQAEAYTAKNLDALAETAAEAWLARPDLNNFDAAPGKIAISKIFDWYQSDFEKEGGVKSFLKKYAPAAAKGKIDGANIGYLDYDWALNAQ